MGVSGHSGRKTLLAKVAAAADPDTTGNVPEVAVTKVEDEEDSAPPAKLPRTDVEAVNDTADVAAGRVQ